MYGYIYLTTNLINGKKYIGKHKSEVFVGNDYIGSGKLLHRDRIANNYINSDYKVELLEECNSLEELNNREIYWISHFNALESNDFYNVHIGGDGGDISLWLSDERMKQIRRNHSKYIKSRIENDEEFRKSFIGAKEGHKCSDQTKDKISKSQSNYWKSISIEDKHNRLSHTASIRNEGRVWITNEEYDKFVNKEDIDAYLDNGFRIGRKFKKRNRKCSTTIESITNEKYVSE